MLAFGEDRSLVAVDLLDRPPGTSGGFFGGGSRPDQRLDIAGPQTAVDLDLKLAQTGSVAPDGSP